MCVTDDYVRVLRLTLLRAKKECMHVCIINDVIAVLVRRIRVRVRIVS